MTTGAGCVGVVAGELDFCTGGAAVEDSPTTSGELLADDEIISPLGIGAATAALCSSIW